MVMKGISFFGNNLRNKKIDSEKEDKAFEELKTALNQSTSQNKELKTALNQSTSQNEDELKTQASNCLKIMTPSSDQTFPSELAKKLVAIVRLLRKFEDDEQIKQKGELVKLLKKDFSEYSEALSLFIIKDCEQKRAVSERKDSNFKHYKQLANLLKDKTSKNKTLAKSIYEEVDKIDLKKRKKSREFKSFVSHHTKVLSAGIAEEISGIKIPIFDGSSVFDLKDKKYPEFSFYLVDKIIKAYEKEMKKENKNITKPMLAQLLLGELEKKEEGTKKRKEIE